MTTTVPVTDTPPRLTLRDVLARARGQRAARLREADEQEAKRLAEGRESARRDLVQRLKRYLGLEIDPSAVRLIEDAKAGRWSSGGVFAEVDIEDVTFSIRRENQTNYRETPELVFKEVCAKGCGKDLWLVVGRDPVNFVEILEDEAQHQHQWACRVQYDANGNAITDAAGQSLKKREPETPRADPVAVYASVVKARRTMEFQRPLMKAAAIKRLLEAGIGVTSATAAEKICESDVEYAAFCATLTNIVVEEITAREQMIAARRRASDDDDEPDGGY